MNKTDFIRKSLDSDLNYWKKALAENETDSMISYYEGAISALNAFKKKIEFYLK